MYSYIIGEVTHIDNDGIILENNGIGYQLATSLMTMSYFQVGDTYKVYTEFVVREESQELYGFYDVEEREMFELLTKVSTIGPKSAMAILSTLTVGQIQQAVLNADIGALSRAPGVGRKTASRIALELVDTIKKMDIVPVTEVGPAQPANNEWQVALDALTNLGYVRNEAEKALASLDSENMSLEEMIKAALRKL